MWIILMLSWEWNDLGGRGWGEGVALILLCGCGILHLSKSGYFFTNSKCVAKTPIQQRIYISAKNAISFCNESPVRNGRCFLVMFIFSPISPRNFKAKIDRNTHYPSTPWQSIHITLNDMNNPHFVWIKSVFQLAIKMNT